jgi:hypothetical protein
VDGRKEFGRRSRTMGGTIQFGKRFTARRRKRQQGHRAPQQRPNSWPRAMLAVCKDPAKGSLGWTNEATNWNFLDSQSLQAQILVYENKIIMSDRHVIHHRGSPRPDREPPSNWEWFFYYTVRVIEGSFSLVASGILALIEAFEEEATQIKIAEQKFCASQKRVQAAFENEWGVMAETVDLPQTDQQKVIDAAFSARLEACKEFDQTRLELLKTLEDTIVSLDKSRDEILKTPHSIQPSDFKTKLNNLDKAKSGIISEIEKIQSHKMEATDMKRLVIKEIKKVRIVDFQGKYVAADLSKGGVFRADRDSAQAWETFSLFDLGNHKFVLLASNKKFVSADQKQKSLLVADRRFPGEWECFEQQDGMNGYVYLSASNGKFVSSRVDEAKLLRACADVPSEWECFKFET